eukprot:snap_masked-scaffold_21-processed-gene-5.47-mRNA-1 protein AED:1.00 eAED:1.00 QI:0/-1/0/0/-1/1/1/0/66
MITPCHGKALAHIVHREKSASKSNIMPLIPIVYFFVVALQCYNIFSHSIPEPMALGKRIYGVLSRV